jgi:glycosyltransferase involved in cell wall biosynthesis
MESFSVTYLEAMRFGVPILTTDLDFARYLCGNAAIFFNPYIRGSFTEKLLEIKRNNVLRNKLISAGYEQLGKFSHTWHNMVNTAIDALEQVVAGNTTKLILRKE